MNVSPEFIMWGLGGICSLLLLLLGIIWKFQRGEVADLKKQIEKSEDSTEKIVKVIFEKLEKNQQLGHDNDASIQSHDAKFAAAKDRMDNIEAQVRDLMRDDRRR
jgi:predicted transcriptional regulator